MPGTEELFTILTDGGQRGRSSFYTGTDAAGRQFLIVPAVMEILGILFDAKGAILEVQERPYSEEDSPQDTINAWQDEVGLIPGLIRVKQFFLHDLADAIGIARYADWMLQAQQNPYQILARDRVEEFQVMAELRAEGAYTFWRGPSDLLITDDGRSVSS